MRYALGIIAALSTLALPAAAEMRLHCGRLVDVRALQVLTERAVVVDGNRITAVYKQTAPTR
jgi:hypothetical protein